MGLLLIRIKELQGGRLSKDLKVPNILTLDKIFNFGISKNDDKKFYSHPI
ncbi:MAG: hypothetical protein K6343_01505 [Caldisericaceae bacterium]